jgi:hypothetical protein
MRLNFLLPLCGLLVAAGYQTDPQIMKIKGKKQFYMLSLAGDSFGGYTIPPETILPTTLNFQPLSGARAGYVRAELADGDLPGVQRVFKPDQKVWVLCFPAPKVKAAENRVKHLFLTARAPEPGKAINVEEIIVSYELATPSQCRGEGMLVSNEPIAEQTWRVDAPTPKDVAKFKSAQKVSRLVTKKGTFLVVAEGDGIFLWDTAGKKRGEMTEIANASPCLDFTGDGIPEFCVQEGLAMGIGCLMPEKCKLPFE